MYFYIIYLIIIFLFIANLISNHIYKEICQFLNDKIELDNKNFKIELKNKSNIKKIDYNVNSNLFSLDNFVTEFEIYLFPLTYFIILILPVSEQFKNEGFLIYKENFQIKQKLIVIYNNFKDKLLKYRISLNKFKLTYCENEDFYKIMCEIFKLNHNKNKRNNKRMKFSL